MENSESIIQQIDVQYKYLLSIRSLFPYMGKKMIGQSMFCTPSFYSTLGFDICFNFNRVLNIEDIDEINSIGNWINQNYIIRICSILESYKIIPQEGKGTINQTIEGWTEIDLIRRLRNNFAHSSGKCNSNDCEQKKLYEMLVSHFNLKLEEGTDNPTMFPLSIDTVLEPLTMGCKKYIKNIPSVLNQSIESEN